MFLIELHHFQWLSMTRVLGTVGPSDRGSGTVRARGPVRRMSQEKLFGPNWFWTIPYYIFCVFLFSWLYCINLRFSVSPILHISTYISTLVQWTHLSLSDDTSWWGSLYDKPLYRLQTFTVPSCAVVCGHTRCRALQLDYSVGNPRKMLCS